MSRKHSHYFKDVSHLRLVDVYRVLKLFGVVDPAVQHAIKKLLLPGSRGSKDLQKDLQEAIDSLQRSLEMIREDDPGDNVIEISRGTVADPDQSISFSSLDSLDFGDLSIHTSEDPGKKVEDDFGLMFYCVDCSQTLPHSKLGSQTDRDNGFGYDYHCEACCNKDTAGGSTD